MNTILNLTLVILISLLSSSAQSQEKSRFARWEKAIAAFEKQDKRNPPPKKAVLFVGSSSIRRWDLQKSFPKIQVINRGFGGSQIADSVHFAPRIILNHQPRIVVVYAGDNDIGSGKSPEQVLKDFQELVKVIRTSLPDTIIVFICIKPSLRRWNLAGPMEKANKLVEAYCSKNKKVIYLDVWTPMLGEAGKPRPELFVKDGLHLSEAGYRLWTNRLRKKLGRSLSPSSN